MPPIPLHKNAPIAPLPSGITPQTASDPSPNLSQDQPTRTLPASVPATTTASSDSPPAPQPGARPVPPTNNTNTHTAPSHEYSGPAPPQPGARPAARTSPSTQPAAYTANVVTTETRLAPQPPPQLSHASPSVSHLAGRSTTTDTRPSKPGPTTLNLGLAASPFQEAHTGGSVIAGEERRSLEHPPDYVQTQHHEHAGQGGDGNASGEGSVGAAAWNALSRAGEALKKGEEAAWRAVRKK